MKCSPEAGTGSEIQSIIKIEQNQLNCGTYLTPKTANSVALQLSYVHNGPKATYEISNFFTVSPKDGCDNTEICSLTSASDFTNCDGTSLTYNDYQLKYEKSGCKEMDATRIGNI